MLELITFFVSLIPRSLDFLRSVVIVPGVNLLGVIVAFGVIMLILRNLVIGANRKGD